MSKFSDKYTDDSFFEKIKTTSRKAGAKVVYQALLLFNILKSEKTPLLDKAIIIGALGYFIFPMDAIPDILGPLGYSDDLSVLAAALAKVRGNLTESIKASAKKDVENIFGEGSFTFSEDGF